MERYHEAVLRKDFGQQIDATEILSKINFRKILLNLLGIIIGRISIFTLNPIIIAFYAVMFRDKASRWFLLFSSMVGMSTSLEFLDVVKYGLIMSMILSIATLIELKGINISIGGLGAIAAFSTLVLGGANAYLQFQNIQLYIKAVMEAATVFALTAILSKGIDYILTAKKQQALTNEELISVSILGASLIAGLSGISVANLSILETVLLFLVLYMGYKHGVGIGAAAGAICGFQMVLIQWAGFEMIGAICLLGIFAGLFRELGKLGSVIGFTIGLWMVGNYYMPELLNLNMIRGLASSLVLLLMIPKKHLQRVNATQEAEPISNNYYREKIKDLTKDKLKGFAASFTKLSGTFASLSEKRTNLSQNEVNHIFDALADKVCASCSQCNACWKEDFYDTYKAAYSILGAAEKKGSIGFMDVPKEFEKKCINLDRFVETTNRLFEMLKINLNWQNKIYESRELVAEQLAGVASIIDSFSEELYDNIDSEKKLEDELEDELRKHGIDVKERIVLEKNNSRREALVTMRSKRNKSLPSKDVAILVGKVLSRKMRLEEGCKSIIGREFSAYKFVEESLYNMAQGVARATKATEKVSGDNFSVIQLNNGQVVLALSDGMGSGLKACRESEATVELLEEFLDAGFEKDTAIKLINSVLVLKSDTQSFSTVDMSIVDLHTGVCELIKIGAASTFIKRSDVVETIKSTSLPVGIFNQVDFDKTVRKLYDGDILVMVTDGVIDSEKIQEKEIFIEQVLSEISSKNPQEIADTILKRVKEKTNYEIKDDMTILVSRIWRK